MGFFPGVFLRLFKGVTSNGVVEGLNNKAKRTIRKSYGFRSSEILEMVL
ncbi:MAG: transposase [Gammaproteobacteria bacterium]|nr:transposase [Gammaproteobacteria bacterium]